jgi:hypothetical protein
VVGSVSSIDELTERMSGVRDTENKSVLVTSERCDDYSFKKSRAPSSKTFHKRKSHKIQELLEDFAENEAPVVKNCITHAIQGVIFKKSMCSQSFKSRVDDDNPNYYDILMNELHAFKQDSQSFSNKK